MTMLPSMPLIGLSTPSKEVQNEDISPTDGCSDNQNVTSAKALDLSITAKKSSPMKHVTPILKKYNSHRKGKGSKKMGMPRDQSPYSERHTLRSIAPKPVMVLGTPSSEDFNGQKDMNETTTVKHEIMDSNDPKKSEERKDSADELAALMLASSTIKSKGRTSNVVKKKYFPKQLRDMEASVTLLTPDDSLVREEKSYGFAQAYFLKVKERLEGTELYHAFLHTMNEFGTSIIEVTDLYQKITALLSQHPDLSEEFLAFLLPEQAMQCGKLMEYLMITKMRDFLRRLEIYFEKQPQQMRKFYSALTTLCGQANVTVADVRTVVLPLLKGNSLLIDNFLNLLPYEKPPESMMTEFEELDFGNKDGNHLGEDDMLETLIVPNQQDAFGGDGCACNCHNSRDDKFSKRAAHCLSCGTRFIHGKIFLQTGKVLRPAKVSFDSENSNESMNRLSAKNRPRPHNRHTIVKFGNSPLKHARMIFGPGKGFSSPKASRTSKTKVSQKPRVSKSCRQLVKTKTPTSSRTGKQPSVRSNAKSSSKSTQSRVSRPPNLQIAAAMDSAKNAATCFVMPVATSSAEATITTTVSPHSSPDAIPLDESAILPPVVGTRISNMKDFSSIAHVLQNTLDETGSRNVILINEHTNVDDTDSSMRDLNPLPVVSNNTQGEQIIEIPEQEVSSVSLIPVPTQSNVENSHSPSPVLQLASSVQQQYEEMDHVSIEKSDFSFSSNLKHSESHGKSIDSISKTLQSDGNESCATEQDAKIGDSEEGGMEESVVIEQERLMNTELEDNEEISLPLETCINTSDANDSDSLIQEDESNADHLVEAMEESSLEDDKNINFHPDSSSVQNEDENDRSHLEEKTVKSAWTREEDKGW
ncbi:hypothetical protein C0J52_05320 [Blattella germanica]|nr:hypothetical protein C0J52_05320 [Blattella germanica]